jgi:hypothetical protein
MISRVRMISIAKLMLKESGSYQIVSIDISV